MKYWQFIHNKLTQNKKLYAMTVIDHSGSSPGRRGFKMAVANDGEIFGSIGGGVMEHNLVELCKNLLGNKDDQIFLKYQNHKGSRHGSSGMICSGEQTLAFHPLNQDHLTVITTILACLQNNEKGTFSLSPQSYSFSPKILSKKYHYKIENEHSWYFKEQLGYKETIYIIGSGHVGLATSKLFSELGFYVVVLDNRKQLNTFEQNAFAHQKCTIDYNAVAEYIPEAKNTYIAIMTNKYTEDKLVLSQLLKKKYKFLGVLGSKAKLEVLFDVMQKEGYTKNELSKVQAPIGLTISSQTPQEIAVSIAAQIIQIKNKD